MNPKQFRSLHIWLVFCAVSLVAISCTPSETTDLTTPTPTATTAVTSSPIVPATATPTPTAVLIEHPTATQPPSKCEGLSGNLGVSIQVGPAEVVGLTPVAVGQVPFSVSGTNDPYTVQGSGTIDFADTLTKEWGSYAVTLNMQAVIDGTCTGSAGAETLHLQIEMSGDQLVVVTSEGFNAEYPWNGTHNFSLDFPLVNGTTVQGEGWSFTLHVNGV
jgi:hypothetical protein